MVGMSMGDRFLITALLGIGATGIFGFYWSFANALQTLVMTSYVQPALPDLLELHEHDPKGWKVRVLKQWLRLVALTLAAAMVIAVVVIVAVRIVPGGRFPDAPVFAVILMAAMAVRTAAEYLSSAIGGSGRSRDYAVANMIGVVLTALLVGIFAWTSGLIGAAAGLLLTAILMTAWRLRLVKVSAVS